MKNLYLAHAGKNVDLLITDVVMPEIDGITLAKEAKKVNPLMKVIGISGYNLAEKSKKVFDYFLSKPFGVNESERIIKKTLAL